MRFFSSILAGTIAVIMYVAITLFGGMFNHISSDPTSSSLGVVPAAYAAPIDDACKNEKPKTACTDGFQNQQINETRDVACNAYQGKELQVCLKGYDAAEAQASNAPPPKGFDNESCSKSNGAMSWFVCPFYESVTRVVSEQARGVIEQFLVVEPLKFEGPTYQLWDAVRTLANVSFILIFLVIIFANTLSININAYTLKQMLPKLVAATILVQASYLISALAVDTGNILGAGVGNLIDAAVGKPPQANPVDYIVLIVAGLGLGSLALAGFGMGSVLFLLILLVTLAAILTLAFRYLLIGILVIVSPLAFAAWVLPGTEQYFKRWYMTLIKLILMYPIIVGLLSLAANADVIVPASATSGSGAGSVAQDLTSVLLKVLLFLACFMAIPGTFKWAGGFMAFAAGKIDDMRKSGTKAVKGSDKYEQARNRMKSKQIARANAIRNGVDKLPGNGRVAMAAKGGLAGAGGLWLAGRTSNSPLGLQRDSSALVNGYVKELGNLKEADRGNQLAALRTYYGTASQRAEAAEELRNNGGEGLASYTRTLEGRQALVRRLAENNLMDVKTLDAIQGFGHPEDLQMVLRENGKNFGKAPMLYGRHAKDDPSKGVVRGDINAKAVQSAMTGMTAGKFRDDDFKIDNLKVASANIPSNTTRVREVAQQAARSFSEMPAIEIQRSFDPSGRNFADANKRAELLKVMARNQADFTATAQGQRLWNAVISQIQANPAQHIDALDNIDNEDDGAAIRTTLGI